jgi:putative FmdB family regulatory protein
MPTYEFHCDSCDQSYEEQKKYDDFESNCPLCNNKSRKIMSAPGINIKGSSNKSVDSVIGEQSEQRWLQIEENKNKRMKDQYGKTVGVQSKENERISNLLNKQNQAFSTIEHAKKEAGITKSDELKHAIGG